MSTCAGASERRVLELQYRAHARIGLLAVMAVTFAGLTCTAAQQAASETQDDGASKASEADQDPKNNGNDLTRPQNSLDLRYGYRKSSGTTSQTDRDYWIVRGTSRIQLDPDWKLSLLAQTELVNKTTFMQGEPRLAGRVRTWQLGFSGGSHPLAE